MIQLSFSKIRTYQQAFLQIIVWTGVFYFSSAVSGIMNKQIISEYSVLPVTLTMWHLVISVAFDGKLPQAPRPLAIGKHTGAPFIAVIVKALGQGHPPGGKSMQQHCYDVLMRFAPIAAFIIAGKMATYFSYQYVSMSLTHTAKALEPVFNVGLSAMFFGEFKPPGVYLSLVPIAMGVGIASITEISYNVSLLHPPHPKHLYQNNLPSYIFPQHIGFAAASASAIFKVLQNIYTKRVMGTAHFSFYEIHLFCGIASIAVLTPWAIVSHVSAAQAVQLPRSGPAVEPELPLLLLAGDSVLQYVSSISSYMVLSLVAHLTFTIVNSMKRLVIITSGTVVFGGFAITNFIGVCMAVGGVFLYNLAKPAKNKNSSSPSANRQHVGDETPVGTPYEAAAAMVLTDVEHARHAAAYGRSPGGGAQLGAEEA